MQVILKKEIQNLGEVGDIINVKDGYARNFLLPQGAAEIATAGALEKAAAIEKFGKLELSAKAGESGKLFGTITTKKLTEELAAQAGIEVDRKAVSLDAPINKIGNYIMLIKLTSKVKCELNISVSASEVVKESIEEQNEEVAE